MTDYYTGFSEGEQAAWRGRNSPLPKRPQIHNERERGYWDARLPRTTPWSRNRISQSWWDEARGRHIAEVA